MASMVEHMVIFKAKAGKDAELDKTLRDFAGEIKKELPGIVELNVGSNYTQRSRDHGWTHGLYARFKDKSVGDAYGPHPVHRALVAKLGDLTDGVEAVDFEF